MIKKDNFPHDMLLGLDTISKFFLSQNENFRIYQIRKNCSYNYIVIIAPHQVNFSSENSQE